MKRINKYKKLFNVEDEIDLKQLKTNYRNLVKRWHPDKFQEGEEGYIQAEIKSKEIIDGYHFLVSIAPQTKTENLEAYTKTISESVIYDFQHKGNVLEISFLDGTTYEYFGVNKAIYIRLINSAKQNRFAKRNIYNSFLYRKSKKDIEFQRV
ncbi:KTSC domain-containing protein [Christiangramia sp.]|uniref:KTSC domain-containing protein n=1 Tax=Christiangramia sp. TaxID=1931228 RepID=UPI00262A2916|nr:KTSC domain-containing protein [Christiangramia sp.]